MKKFLLCASAFALLLGSCSKDDTEVTSVEVNGKIAFTASMQIGNATRTHLEETLNGFEYAWDNGDMIGATINGGDEVIPFIASGSGTGEIGFDWEEWDLNYLGLPPYYLVYPYDKDAKVANYNVTMTIPSSQRYRENSFATMTAPAVQVISELENDEIPSVKMRPVASYVRVPVVGAGKLTKLSMTIQNADKEYYKLCGSASVNLRNIETAVLAIPGTDKDKVENVSSVSVSWGNNGLDLKYDEAKNVWFIIPANTTLAGSYITFTAVVDGKESTVALPQIPTTTSTKTLLANKTLPIPSNISFGTENMVMIKNTEDFLKYAFAANYNAKLTLSDDPINDSIAAEYYKDGKFKTAVLLADLNYRNYAAQDVYQDAVQSEEQDEILLEALKSYMQNGGGIASFDSAVSIDGNGHKISYLPVYGNGIFAAAPSLLKDLTIQQATVNFPDDTKTTASFLGRLTSFRNVSGVTIYGGSLLNVAEGVTPTMVGATANASTLPLKAQMTISRYPTVNGVAADYAYYATTLNINADVVANNPDKAVFINSATPRFAKFKGSKDGAIISMVSNATIAKVILDAVDNTGKSFSVMDRAKVSYWTGTVPASVTDDDTVTAEDLAYYVRNGGSVTLTNNIDLQGEQGKEWVLDNGSAALNITGNGKYTISNALVKSQKVTEPYVAYSLLGNVVNAKDIVVDGVTIDVDNVEGSTAQLYVGGLGYQGSANGVKVSNLTIDIAEDVKVSTYNEVGGLISAPSAASEGNTVSDISININGNETVGPVGGMFGVMGKATFDGNSVVYKDAAAVKYPLLGAWTVYASTDVAACSVGVGDPLTVSTEENPIAPVVGVITFNPTNVSPGTQIWLNFVDECSAPYYSEIKNGVDYAYNVKINGNEVPVYKPE